MVAKSRWNDRQTCEISDLGCRLYDQGPAQRSTSKGPGIHYKYLAILRARPRQNGFPHQNRCKHFQRKPTRVPHCCWPAEVVPTAASAPVRRLVATATALEGDIQSSSAMGRGPSGQRI